MTLEQSEVNEARRANILARSELTRIWLNDHLHGSTPEQWEEEFNEARNVTRALLEQDFTKHWMIRASFQLPFNHDLIFNDDASPNIQMQTKELLFELGHSIGDKDDVGFLLPEIFERIKKDGILNNKNEAAIQRSFHMALITGVELKKDDNKHPHKIKATDIHPSITEAIAGIDAIDKL